MYSWSVPKNSLVTVYDVKQLKTHVCTQQELGFGLREDSTFYPIKQEMKQDVYRLLGNWHCLDQFQEIDMNGHFSSSKADQLMIRLRKC